jgi:hypothetical protein
MGMDKDMAMCPKSDVYASVLVSKFMWDFGMLMLI